MMVVRLQSEWDRWKNHLSIGYAGLLLVWALLTGGSPPQHPASVAPDNMHKMEHVAVAMQEHRPYDEGRVRL